MVLLREEVACASDFHQAAKIHDGDPMAEPLDCRKVMRNEQIRDTPNEA
jgi:hypothetical protein